jgi:ribonuclease HI
VQSTVTIAVDGSSLGNPGPGGWAWFHSERCWAAGQLPRVTNNVAELTAVTEVLTAVPDDVALRLVADSRYVIDALTKWIWGWRRRGWRTSSGAPVSNKELIVRCADLLERRDVTFEWVRGHAGHPLNEGADRKARAAAERLRNGMGCDSGPGWTR